MRVQWIIVHSSNTQPDARVDVRTIDRWFRDRGHGRVGFHFVIPTSGVIQVGRMEHEDGAHLAGYNKTALGICLVGGLDAQNDPAPMYTKAQWESLAILVRGLLMRYPRSKLRGHREMIGHSEKQCPSFNVTDWWEGMNR